MPLRAPDQTMRLDQVKALAVGALGFFCCMPYVALPVGARTALQVGSILSLALAAPSIYFCRRRDFWLALVLSVPLLVSALKVGVVEDDLELAIKSVVTMILCFTTVIAATAWTPKYANAMQTGIAMAIVLHVVVGAVQIYSFSIGQFPLESFYNNPSFLSVQDNADTIARYIQRPFGLFPEPSAMSSSLAPWALFWLAEGFGLVRLREQPASWQRLLFRCAAVSALGLIIVSRSGHAAVTLAAAGLFVVLWFSRCRATARTYWVLVAIVAVALPMVIYFAADALGDRLRGKSELGNSSWEDRFNSLSFGLRLLVDRDFATLIFGVGPGLTSPILQRIVRMEAVWSVLLTYVYETGVIGAIAVTIVAQHLARAWKQVRYSIAFAAIAIVWLVGITVTTSYVELLPLWLTLGWLAIWPTICAPLEVAGGGRRSVGRNLSHKPLKQSETTRSNYPRNWKLKVIDLTTQSEQPASAQKAPAIHRRWSHK